MNKENIFVKNQGYSVKHKIKNGESLSDILKKYYGNSGLNMRIIEVSLIVADIKMDENSSFHIFVFRCCGGLLIYTLGYFLGPQWKTLAFICCPVPILSFLASMYSPQSPVFLVSHGEEPEALSAIKKLYGPQYDSNMELAMIKKGL